MKETTETCNFLLLVIKYCVKAKTQGTLQFFFPFKYRRVVDRKVSDPKHGTSSAFKFFFFQKILVSVAFYVRTRSTTGVK